MTGVILTMSLIQLQVSTNIKNKYKPSLRYQISGYFDPNKKYLLSELKDRHKYVSGIGTFQNFVPAYSDDIGVDRTKMWLLQS